MMTHATTPAAMRLTTDIVTVEPVVDPKPKSRWDDRASLSGVYAVHPKSAPPRRVLIGTHAVNAVAMIAGWANSGEDGGSDTQTATV